jgi:uncharacterized protein
MADLVPRLAESRLTELLDALRVVVVNGPRQAGKTTLLRSLQSGRDGEYRSLDDPIVQQAAVEDPTTFAGYGGRPLIIDEVQRGGDTLIRAVKYVVDQDNSPGQFVLSGSTRFLTVPTLSESLAGRAAFIDLWPFAVAERVGDDGRICDELFEEPAGLLARPPSPWQRDEYLSLLCTGSFPEAVRLTSRRQRLAWFAGYLRTVTTRDVREFATVHQPAVLVDLLALVAARAGGGVVVADLARSVGLSPETVRNYLSYLETVFLLATVPAWSTNLSAKIAKTPKAYVTDGGLAAHLLRVTPEALRNPGHPALGGLVETFAVAELVKLQTAAETDFSIRHLRDRDGREVDLVLEAADGRVIAIEIKASSSPAADDARHLRWLRQRLGSTFVAGVVLYLGRQSLSLGDGIYALPLSALWRHRPPPGAV